MIPPKEFYKKYLHYFRIQIAVPATYAFILFALPILQQADYIGIKTILSVGLLIVLLTSYHGYLINSLTNTEIDAYKEKVSELQQKFNVSVNENNIYRHLIEVTNRLVNEKRSILSSSGTLDPLDRFRICIYLNLMMLYEFYKIHSAPGINFRIVYFIPSDDNNHLIPLIWYNEKVRQPHSMGTPERYHEHFSFDSDLKVCYSWRNKDIFIVEDADKERLKMSYPGQETYLKSMLTYPVLGIDSSVTSIISFIADVPCFFKRENINYHRFVFDHFATRIIFEHDDLQTSSK